MTARSGHDAAGPALSKRMSEETGTRHDECSSGRPRWRAVVCYFAISLTPLLHTDAALSQAREPLELVQTIALPDVQGRIDHMDIDLDGERLFVAALGNNTVEVIDLRAGKRSARLERLQEPQGIAYVPEGKRLFVANGRGGRVDVFDGASLAAVGHVDGLEDADNVRYQRDGGRVYVGYASALAAIDAATLKVAAQIKLAGHPESFQLERGGSHMFVNVPSAQHIAIVDWKKNSIVATWGLGDMKANFPMALDEPGRRLFVATRWPAALLVHDTNAGKLIANLPIGGDADDVFFDAERKRIYVICGQGVIDVVLQRDADHYQSVAQVPSAPGARTGLFVAARKTLYVAVPARGSSGAEIRVYAVR
jgi:YVTN family beta-propeller protein